MGAAERAQAVIDAFAAAREDWSFEAVRGNQTLVLSQRPAPVLNRLGDV